MSRAYLHVRAVAVHDNGNGIFTLSIPAQEVSEEDRAALRRLFPHTTEQAWELLNKEVILGSLVSESEAHSAPPLDPGAADEARCEARWLKDSGITKTDSLGVKAPKLK